MEISGSLESCRRTNSEPMKPQPPVTRIRIMNSPRLARNLYGRGPNSCLVRKTSSRLFLAPRLLTRHRAQIVPVGVLQFRSQLSELVGRNIAHAAGHLFDAADFHALPAFDDLDEVRRLKQRLGSSRVEPGETAPALLDAKLMPIHVFPVHVGYFQFTAGRGFERFGNLQNLIVVKIKARYGQIRSGAGWFLFDRDRPALLIELDDAVGFCVAHVVGKHRGAVRLAGGAAQKFLQSRTVKNVIAENQGRVVASDELAADQKRLRQTPGMRLNGI